MIELNLTEEEVKKIKKDFKNGQVYTDGCFCGQAVSNFRDNLYVVIDFSCRKSSDVESRYFKVNSVYVTEQALVEYDRKMVAEMMQEVEEKDLEEIMGRKFILVDWVEREIIEENLHFVCEGLLFSEKSLKKIQKKLFKYYLKTYGKGTDARFKDIERFNY